LQMIEYPAIKTVQFNLFHLVTLYFFQRLFLI
jgi:hypothetical protein